MIESANHVYAGQEIHLKSLASELRVLVCLSGGTEGLLWRLVDEVGADDRVFAKTISEPKIPHPPGKGIRFSYMPLLRVGDSSEGLVPKSGHRSLKSIIKHDDAVVVSHIGYSHEVVISAVAQQMGSAHEDEGIEQYLIELSECLLGDRSVLKSLFYSQADYIVEVGMRVLRLAEKDLSFRQQLPLDAADWTKRQSVDAEPISDLPDWDRSTLKEGTVALYLDNKDPDWMINDERYDIGPIIFGKLHIIAIKHSDRTLEIRVDGLANNQLIVRPDLPTTKGLLVLAIRWINETVDFWLNGKQSAVCMRKSVSDWEEDAS